ncbi:MAG TPA: ATP synthase F1 subunit epsilon [Flavobacteriales bacterium]|nr:ATP synthase F1 subunit epsilon [Flavobacteriales bacterium]
MKIEIVTPEKDLYSGDIESAVFPGMLGSFGVLKNHAPLISTLQEGLIELVESDNKKKSFEIKGGVVEVLNNKIIVLAE